MAKKTKTKAQPGPSVAGWMSALMLVAALCFLALIALQALELRTYGAGPSLWPPG